MDEHALHDLGLLDNIHVLDVPGADNWIVELEALIQQAYRGTPGSSGRIEGPLLHILHGMQQIGCQAVVIEEQYFDEDYLDVFRAFYCRSLTEYPRNCVRLHFFRCRLTRLDLVRLATEQQQAYLGFAVVPPVAGFLTGRTVVRPWHDDGHTEFVTCKISVQVNLSGNALTARGAPFIQQDTNVNVCAGASLWSVSHHMWTEHSYRRFRPAEITNLATRYLTIGQQNRGLTPEQIAMAMREMGYLPLPFPNAWPDEPQNLARIIHAYIESEIPVLVLLETDRVGHAVCAVGHNFVVPGECGGHYQYNSDWIECFYIQDDAYGPYQQLFVASHDEGYSIQDNVTSVLVPAPQGVAMEADTVFGYVQALLPLTNELLAVCTDDPEALLDEALLDRLMKRTYLRRSNQFKVDVGSSLAAASEGAAAMSEGFAAKYRSMRMPKYVWVTELSTPELLCHDRGADRRILGEIVIDSTASFNSTLPDAVQAVHLDGRMLARVNDPVCPFRVFLDESEAPYPHLVREP